MVIPTVNKIIVRTKMHSVSKAIVFILAVIASAVSLFASADTDAKPVQKLVSTSDVPKIKSAKAPLSIEEAKHLGLELTYGNKDDQEYALLLRVNAKFINPQFNREPYLGSISEFNISLPPGTPTKKNILPRLIPLSDAKDKLSWWALVVFPSKPVPSQNLVVSLGPNQWIVPVGSHEWQSFPYKYGAPNNNWFRAQAELMLSVKDPSWAFVRSARLLNAKKEKGPLLEVVIENRAKTPLAIDSLAISATDPMVPGANKNCEYAEQQQDLMLNWGMVSSYEAKPGQWTQLSDTPVQVQVKFNGKGECSIFSFFAAVPVSTNVSAMEVRRFLLKITELPPLNTHSQTTPSSILQWQNLNIGFNLDGKSSAPIFPHELKVEPSVKN